MNSASNGNATKPSQEPATKYPIDFVTENPAGDLRHGQFWTSQPLETLDQKLRLHGVIEGSADGSAQWINQVLGVVNVTMFPDRILSKQSGELVDVIVTIIHTDSGDDIRFTSGGIARSIVRLLQLGLQPPYDPPLRLCLKQIPLDDGRSMLTLVAPKDSESPRRK